MLKFRIRSFSLKHLFVAVYENTYVEFWIWRTGNTSNVSYQRNYLLLKCSYLSLVSIKLTTNVGISLHVWTSRWFDGCCILSMFMWTSVSFHSVNYISRYSCVWSWLNQTLCPQLNQPNASKSVNWICPFAVSSCYESLNFSWTWWSNACFDVQEKKSMKKVRPI